MGIWSFYFLLKLGLHVQGHIFMDWRFNLAFAGTLLLPITAAWLRWSRQLVAIPLGAALLYRESPLPPFSRLVSELESISTFDGQYLLELAGRFVSLQMIGSLFALLFLYWVLSSKLRISSFALLGILLVPAHTAVLQLSAATTATPALQNRSARIELTPDQKLASFHKDEALRQVSFEPTLDEQKPFDIVLLHVCSLAWDDLDLLAQSQTNLLERAAIRFDAFNTAASYSGPAAIRLLRATCGQDTHSALYNPPRSSCLIFNQLAQVGYRNRIALNHTGKFGNFLSDITNNSGGVAQLMNTTNLPQKMRQFDGDPVYSDLAVLKQWAKTRLDGPEALYFNTTSLHDGNRLLDRPSLGSVESFPIRLQGLFTDIRRFLDDLESRGRPAVVVLIPEHGAALRADHEHIAGLREVPTPAVTHAPVLVYLTGGAGPVNPVQISEPTSYLALAELLARLLENSPFGPQPRSLADYATGLPNTDFVSENNGLIVMRNESRFLKRDPIGNWETLNSGLGRLPALLGRPQAVAAAGDTYDE